MILGLFDDALACSGHALITKHLSFDEYQWEVPEYITEDDFRTELERARDVPTRIFLQINVRI